MKRYPVVFSAPQGWGKTTHSQALMKQYGCKSVVDNWTPDLPLVNGALHLTNIRPTPTFMRHMRSHQFRMVVQGWPAMRGIPTCA